MKFCPRCNSENQDYNQVCSSCGTPFHPYQDQNPYRPQKTSGFAIASMVLGICAIPFLCLYCSGLVLAILAIIFGFLAKSAIKTQGLQGNGMATAGIVLGFVAVGIAVILIVLVVAGTFSLDENFWREFQNQMQERNSY